MILAVVGIWVGAANAEVILTDGFETDTSAWYVEGVNGASIVDSPVYEGAKSLKLIKFDGGAPSLQRRFMNEAARNVEVAMWVYIPADSVAERALDIELRDPNQAGGEQLGPYVLFKGTQGLGVFTNHTGWSAVFTKVADIVPDQWTKLVIRTNVLTKRMTIEYNGVLYDNSGQGYGWATTTPSVLGKIKITGPTAGTATTCYIDGLTVTEVSGTPSTGLLFKDNFETVQSASVFPEPAGSFCLPSALLWSTIESFDLNTYIKDAAGLVVYNQSAGVSVGEGNQALRMFGNIYNTTRIDCGFSQRTNQALISFLMYIPSSDVGQKCISINVRNYSMAGKGDKSLNIGPFIYVTNDADGQWGLCYVGNNYAVKKLVDPVLDQWVRVEIGVIDAATKTYFLKYNGITYSNLPFCESWWGSTGDVLMGAFNFSASGCTGCTYIDDVTVVDSTTPVNPADPTLILNDNFETVAGASAFPAADGQTYFPTSMIWSTIESFDQASWVVDASSLAVYNPQAGAPVYEGNQSLRFQGKPYNSTRIDGGFASRTTVATISFAMYISSGDVGLDTFHANVRNYSIAGRNGHDLWLGPYIAVKTDANGNWGLCFYGDNYVCTKLVDPVLDQWTPVVITVEDATTRLYTLTYNGHNYYNLPFCESWWGDTGDFAMGAVHFSANLCSGVTYLDDVKVRNVVEVKIPGDANGDKMVDVGDLGILAANYGKTTGADWSQGDFNNDGAVDVGDLGILAANYGKGTPSALNFSADYAKVFGTADAEQAADDTADNSVCSALGLPLIAGLVLMGLMLVKLDE